MQEKLSEDKDASIQNAQSKLHMDLQEVEHKFGPPISTATVKRVMG